MFLNNYNTNTNNNNNNNNNNRILLQDDLSVQIRSAIIRVLIFKYLQLNRVQIEDKKIKNIITS